MGLRQTAERPDRLRRAARQALSRALWWVWLRQRRPGPAAAGPGACAARAGAATATAGVPTLGVMAMMRNEAPYILEWIAHHRLVGVSRFYIADNGSDDGLGSILAALDRAGVVRRIDFPGTPGTPPQKHGHRALILAAGTEVDWLAAIDADEFIEPRAGYRRATDWLQTLPAEVGGVAMNWACYGSAGRNAPGEGLVAERFPRRGHDARAPNRHYKMIVRPACIRRMISPHHLELAEGFAIVDSNGNPLAEAGRKASGRSRACVWGALRLRHYAVKSRSEFFFRKLPLRRTTSGELRSPGYFAAHDFNEVPDPFPGPHLEALKAEVERLRALLSDLPEPLRHPERMLAALPVVDPQALDAAVAAGDPALIPR